MKERVKKKVEAVLNALGLTAKAKAKAMTPDDWKRFNASYKSLYGVSLDEDNAADVSREASGIPADLSREIIRLAGTLNPASATEEEEKEEEEEEEEAETVEE